MSSLATTLNDVYAALYRTKDVYNYVVREMENASRHTQFFGASVDQFKTFELEIQQCLKRQQLPIESNIGMTDEALRKISLHLSALTGDRDHHLLSEALNQTSKLITAYERVPDSGDSATDELIGGHLQYLRTAYDRLHEMHEFRKRAIE